MIDNNNLTINNTQTNKNLNMKNYINTTNNSNKLSSF